MTQMFQQLRRGSYLRAGRYPPSQALAGRAFRVRTNSCGPIRILRALSSASYL
jgi:hypothetical protein